MWKEGNGERGETLRVVSERETEKAELVQEGRQGGG